MKLTTLLNAYIKARGEESAAYHRLGRRYENDGPVRTSAVDALEERLYRRERQTTLFLARLEAGLEKINKDNNTVAKLCPDCGVEWELSED